MEEKVHELNRQLQEKMRQRVELSAKGNKSASDSNHIVTSRNQLKPNTRVEIRTPDDFLISPEYYSDSGVATSSFTISSKRNSHSEHDGQV